MEATTEEMLGTTTNERYETEQTTGNWIETTLEDDQEEETTRNDEMTTESESETSIGI